MKVHLVYAHPQKDSYNHAFKLTAIETLQKAGHQIEISDLYAMKFKAAADRDDFMPTQENSLPSMYSLAQTAATEHGQLTEDIRREQEKLKWCDLLILQFPLWWFSVPAILKGWFDRVLTKGFAFSDGHWFKTSPLFGRKALLVLTTEGPESIYSAFGTHGNIDKLLYPISHMLHFTGFSTAVPFVVYGVMAMDHEARQVYLDKYAKKLQSLDIPFTVEF